METRAYAQAMSGKAFLIILAALAATPAPAREPAFEPDRKRALVITKMRSCDNENARL